MTTKQWLPWVIFAVMLITIAGLSWGLYNANQKTNDAEHNLMVMQDSVKTLVLKNGEQLATINSYILDKEELSRYIDVQASEIKELEKKVGKLQYIANIGAQIVYDSIEVHDTLWYNNEQWGGSLVYRDDWLSLNGDIRINGNIGLLRTYDMTINSMIVNCPLQVGLTDEYKIWVKSKNPYVQITDLEGASLKKQQVQKKTYWSLGLQLGVGPQWGFIHQNFDVGFYFGVGGAFGWNF